MKVFKNIAVVAIVFSGVVCAKQLVDAVQKKESAATMLHESTQKLHAKIQSTLDSISTDQKVEKNLATVHVASLKTEEASLKQHEAFKIDDVCDHCEKLFTTEVVL